MYKCHFCQKNILQSTDSFGHSLEEGKIIRSWHINCMFQPVKEKTKLAVARRDGFKCFCGRQYPIERTPHHSFTRSEYFGSDRNDAWNLRTICLYCHKKIHQDAELANKLRLEAFERYEGKNKKELEKILEQRKALTK